jgi:hypothetical protein
MRKLTIILSLLVSIAMNAQYSTPGFYRVHSVNTDSYISIKGTHFVWSSDPDAFWPCILMLQDSVQVTDPGSIIYIPGLEQTSLRAQGVGTYELTNLYMDVSPAKVNEGGRDTYIAVTVVQVQGRPFKCYFRDGGFGLCAGSSDNTQSRWWIEPVNEESMETSYLAVKPASEDVKDAEGWYWTSLCCDFPVLLPVDGGIEGAYTVTEVKQGTDGFYYAAPVKVYGQGETVPAATPVLLKCQSAYASGNKLLPVGEIANNTTFPLVNDLLRGNYFSSFYNHSSPSDINAMKEYIPSQATLASASNLALGINDNGQLGFFPKAAGTYMDANTAWLSLDGLDLDGVTAVYLGNAPEPEVQTGDVDGDGVIDINDVTLILDYLLGVATGFREGQINLEAADINHDGVVDVNDVTDLIDILLGCN